MSVKIILENFYMSAIYSRLLNLPKFQIMQKFSLRRSKNGHNVGPSPNTEDSLCLTISSTNQFFNPSINVPSSSQQRDEVPLRSIAETEKSLSENTSPRRNAVEVNAEHFECQSKVTDYQENQSTLGMNGEDGLDPDQSETSLTKDTSAPTPPPQPITLPTTSDTIATIHPEDHNSREDVGTAFCAIFSSVLSDSIRQLPSNALVTRNAVAASTSFPQSQPFPQVRLSVGWATAHDWANCQPLITTLYRDQYLTLKGTMQVMEDEHGFVAR
jgi:hypothetical protein